MRQSIFLLFVSLFLVSCGQNDTKQKELELKERELNLKEREFVLKQKASDSLNSSVPLPIQKDTNQVTNNTLTDTKVLTLTNPNYYWGDGPHLTFKDFTTHETKTFLIGDWEEDIKTIQEITAKCGDGDGSSDCQKLKGQVYKATLKFKLADIYRYNAEDEVWDKSGKKQKRWVITAMEKV